MEQEFDPELLQEDIPTMMFYRNSMTSKIIHTLGN